jgi:membrane fusion protein, multidrug efflux system
MVKRMLIMLIVVGAALGAVFGFKAFVGMKIAESMAAAGYPPQTVSTAVAQTTDWQPQVEAVGSMRAVNGTDLSLELSGLVDTIEFKSGDDVRAGQLLLRLRVDDDIAKLQSLEAAAQLAQINYDRDIKQLKPGAVSQATVDSDAATLKSSVAQVAQQRALLDKKILRAPFAGRLGLRQVDLGQYLSPGTVIVTLQALDPIFVDFLVPQQTSGRLKVGQTIRVKVDTYPGRTFPGDIVAISPKVEASSRNFQVRATLKNPDHSLLPGMYATVVIDAGEPQRLVTLPQTAITYNSFGSTVYLVAEKGKNAKGQPQLVAKQTFVTTGATRGDQVAVLTGIKEGDTVVTAGQLKLREGTPLVVNNTVKPLDNPDPVPKDQ